MRMTRHPARWAFGLLVLFVAGLAILQIRDRTPPPPPASDVPTASRPPKGSQPGSTSGSDSEAPMPPVTILPVAAELSAALTLKDNPESGLQAVGQLLYFYRQGFGENPVGQNEDIVEALLGGNPGHAAYLPPDCPAIQDGKLVDQWGTPYWFHPISGKHTEVRSAGPDRDLFTPDDLVLD